MNMEIRQSWEQEDFRRAIRSMRCPFCGSGVESDYIEFECRAKLQVGHATDPYQRYTNDWEDPHANVEQFQLDNTSLVQCGGCTVSSLLARWFLLDDLVKQVQFFTIEFVREHEAAPPRLGLRLAARRDPGAYRGESQATNALEYAQRAPAHQSPAVAAVRERV